MGIKNIFKKKEPTEQELVEDLQKVGISTRTGSGRQEKFSAFKQYANERQSQRPGLAPANPYAQTSNGSQNPYNSSTLPGDLQTGADPRNGQDGRLPHGFQSKPYEIETRKSQMGHSTSHNHQPKNNIGKTDLNSSSLIDPRSGSADTYRSGNMSDKNAYQSRAPRPNSSTHFPRDTESTLDLNDIPTNRPHIQIKGLARKPSGADKETLDLNNLSDEDLNVDVDEFLSEQEQINSEDEEVEAIKQDIRFTKQESVASTRNTLRMAQEAEASGTNTLGMLGSQSERLYNAEQNLLLADTQTKIADEKVKELGRLNRSIFIPATGNPFNKKSRLRQQESKLKAEKIQEKYLRDTNRKEMYASEQRLTQGITTKNPNSELFNKYQGEKQISQAQRYQFENDSEDDEMEKELASNLDQISNYSKKLKNTAKIMGQEVQAQNDRLRRIEEDADRLDINVHLNSSRLNNIR